MVITSHRHWFGWKWKRRWPVLQQRTNILQLIYILHEKCQRSFFLVRIFPHLDWIRRFFLKSPYSVQMQENADQKTLNKDTFTVVTIKVSCCKERMSGRRDLRIRKTSMRGPKIFTAAKGDSLDFFKFSPNIFHPTLVDTRIFMTTPLYCL